MNAHSDAETIDRRLTFIRLIVGAMLSGVLIVAGGAAWWVSQNPPEPHLHRTHYALLGLAGASVVIVVGLMLLRRVFLAQAAQADLPPTGANIDAILAAVAPSFQAWTLVQAALAEGLGMFGVGVHIVTGHVGGLAGAALAAALLARARPSRDHLRRFASVVVGRPL